MTGTSGVPEMRLELVPVPVSDVDRAKAFYEQAGFGNLHDTQVTDTMRVVQLLTLHRCRADLIPDFIPRPNRSATTESDV